MTPSQLKSQLAIAVIVPSLEPTGPVRVALDLRELFIQGGHEVHMFYFDEKENAIEVSNSCRLDFFSSTSFQKYDIIHSHGLRPDLYVKWHNKKLNIPLLTTLHNYVTEDLKFAYNSFVSWIFTKVWSWATSSHNACVVLSLDMKKYYARFWRNSNLIIINNTRVVKVEKREDDLAKKIISFRENSILLGSFSHVTERKGLDQVLDLLKFNEQYKFAHFGSGKYIEKLKARASEYGIQNRILWLGYNKDAIHYCNCFDAVVIPSISEGFPLALLEAVQLEVPVVCSNIPVMQEIFNDDEVAQFELFNIPDFHKAIQRSLVNKESQTQKALNKYNSTYCTSIVFKNYEDLYLRLISNT